VKDLRPVAGSADRWERAFGYLAESFACAESDDVVIVAELRRHALWATLTAFDTGFAEALERATASAPAPAAVRRAIAFIDENAHSDITVDDVARAVHMSSRGLQYAFRRALGTTPAEQLRRARLDGAHRELLRGDGTTVTRIARTWGFAHPSRFATERCTA
jgi:AraC-like DNA-binding protein